MRSRNIKPGVFSNEKLAELDPLARILFMGLWCVADKSGRLEDRPARIKIEVLPYDDVDCNELLNALSLAKFINRYEVNGVAYIEVVNFLRHQNPHYKEKDSEIPPHKRCRKPRKVAYKPSKGTSKTGINPADSGFLIPDTGFLKDGFDLFWTAYPNKKGKAPAEKSWNKLKPDSDLVGVIVSAIAAQKKTAQWQKDNGQFIPMPATWLNQRRWEDEIESKPADQRDLQRERQLKEARERAGR